MGLFSRRLEANAIRELKRYLALERLFAGWEGLAGVGFKARIL